LFHITNYKTRASTAHNSKLRSNHNDSHNHTSNNCAKECNGNAVLTSNLVLRWKQTMETWVINVFCEPSKRSLHAFDSTGRICTAGFILASGYPSGKKFGLNV